ncbi:MULTISPECIES: alpha/beta hydrolase [Agrobacterium]|uniref:Alpha/beta hydrolase n=1 Tax=Agrobacterium rosae TaxID=1972867 RepID=A0AAW9FB22_9HYPH|nr:MULTISPECIES: alpha/beta hydrolase [Agrobacterium]MDX8302481.1 alpha/beta hydrolase [Agrobacterium rosae]POO55740.1 serine hydrolase family protein [Agrobacterium rosae]SCX16077.1 putative esterase of the alpha/beta hydrolase fold protein [Agrobacterium sp. DSM 25558]
MCTTLIVPGLNGSGSDHWQHYWLQDDSGARLVDQENWQCPFLADWLESFERALAKMDHAYVVAHSLGCILVANMAGRPLATKIRGALLVAPAQLERVEALHPCIVSFGEAPISPLPFPSAVIGSDNDPYMTAEELELASSLWGSTHINLGSVGHINVASGFGRWSQGYDLMDRLKGAGLPNQVSRITDHRAFA